ncbi:MAG: LTD domain-containing protein, partial [Bacteroidetes bacterium]|nr:LTD domain-containing protein [Bacteroidota bacterium]
NPILASDSASLSALHSALPAGNHRFYASVSYLQDENNANDTLSITVGVASLKGALVVNEIMYDPLSNQNEWIELQNRSSSPIDLAGWKFSDRPTTSGSNTFIITAQTRIAQPGDFVVVVAESTVLQLYPNLISPTPNLHLFILNRSGGLSLGNDGDDIILKDLTGKVIDSVAYLPAWHHPDVTDTKGRSLERINPNLDTNDPRNWSTATGFLGGSPGGSNTIFTRTLSVSASLSISPNPFSPDGDGFEDFCSISYDLPSSTSLIHLRIYDIKGRLIRTLANAEFSGAKGSVIWDGLDNGKQRARIGPYVVFIEALDGQGGTVHSAKAVVVVATRL